MPLDNLDEIKGLIETQGKAFEAFKETAEELKKSDGLTAEKLAKIEKSLDDAVEGKAKLEARIEAERKEREDLEAKLNRLGVKGGTEAEARISSHPDRSVRRVDTDREVVLGYQCDLQETTRRIGQFIILLKSSSTTDCSEKRRSASCLIFSFVGLPTFSFSSGAFHPPVTRNF